MVGVKDDIVGVDNLFESTDKPVSEGTYRHLGIEGGLKNFLEILFAEKLNKSRTIRATRGDSNGNLHSRDLPL